MFFDEDHNHKLVLDHDGKTCRFERTAMPDDFERILMSTQQVFGNVA